MFHDRTPVSSDDNVLTATSWDAFSTDTGATEATYNISVSQLAQAQKNTGAELNKTGASVVDTGSNTFNLNVHGVDHELNIDVADGNTNEIVLEKIATAVNAAGLGITADVIENDSDGTQHLVVQSDATGQAGGFTLSDVSGNAVSATAMDTVTTEAQDAKFSVDGTEQSAGSNTVYLDDGMVSVSLKGTGEADLKVGPSEDDVYNNVSGFVSAINSFIDFNHDNSDYITDEVVSSVNAFVAAHENQLESMGITQGEEGKLQIDSDKLADAISNDLSGVEETFAGFDGLAVQVERYAAQVSTDSPLNYAKETEGMSADFTDYIYSASAGMMGQILRGSLLDQYM